MTEPAKTALLAIPVLMLSLAGARGSDERPADAPAPATQPAAEVRRAVETVTKHKNLRLSNDPQSMAEKFTFRCHIRLPAAAGRQPADVQVVRDGGQIGMLVVGKDGLPFCYLTDGLLVAIDQAKPGGLVMHQGGGVTFKLHGEAGLTHVDFGYSADRPGSTIGLDPAAALSGILEKVAHGRFDPARQVAEIRTVRGHRVVLKLAEQKATYPLLALLIQSADGLGFAVGQVVPGAVPKAQLAGRSADDVKKLGLPVRELTRAEINPRLILPPKTFGEAEGERAAAKAFTGLFAPTPPVTQPGK